jgi:hypothetical protein
LILPVTKDEVVRSRLLFPGSQGRRELAGAALIRWESHELQRAMQHYSCPAAFAS